MTARVNVLIAGGGVAGLEAALSLRELLRERAALTLLSATETFHFRPLAVGVPFGLGRPMEHDLGLLARQAGAELTLGELAAVSPEDREAVLSDGDRLSFDHLLVATGACAAAPGPFGVTFGGGEFDEVLADLQAGLISHVAFVVDRETTWPLPVYELALMTAAWGCAARPEGVRVSVISSEATPLELFGPAASAEVASRLAAAGVGFVGGDEPVLESHTSVLAGGRRRTAERIVVLPEARGPAIQGLPSVRGYLPVDPWGRVAGVRHIYAAGDAAGHAIKHGGLAAQQATAAAAAIAHDAGGGPSPVLPRFVLRGLLRTVQGPLYLRAVLGDEEATSTASADPLWWPPSKLAAPRVSSLVGRLEQERARGFVLPTGGLQAMV